MTYLSFFAVLTALFASAAFADEKPEYFSDGRGFVTYLKPFEDRVEGKLKVVSFFDYDCAACVTADDYLKSYAERNPDKIVLERYPYFNQGKTFTARMHATFIEIGRPDLSDLYLFDSDGQKDEVSLTKQDKEISRWLARHGIDPVEFNRTFKSDAVKQRVKESAELYRRYSPPHAPVAILNGKYILVQNTLYNDDYTFAVLDFLVEKLQNEQKESKK